MVHSPEQKQALLVISFALPGGAPQSAYSTTLAATGGTGPYRWSIVKGSLPVGLTIAGSGLISGTPTQAGTSAFTVQVKDSSSPAATATANLSIDVAAVAQSPLITTTSLPGGTTGTAYSATLQASGGTTPYSWTVSSGTLPAGLSSRCVDRSNFRNSHNLRNRIVLRAGDRRSHQHGNQGVEYHGGSGRTAANGHDGVITWRHGRHSYSTTLQASGGTTPYSWSLSAGTLPAGSELGGIDGRDLWDADGSGNCVVYCAGDRRSK